jgi:two-component system sensor histidine kinase EvgS
MESVGRLAGGVAHDFNNMMGVILGRAELCLVKMGTDNPFRESMEAILNAGHRSADLTRQLLAFARKQTIKPRVLDLNDTIENMIKMLRRLIGENIDLDWKPGAFLWAVKMDTIQVDQILANLCVNARDAISNTGNLTIETENKILDENYCAVHAGCIPGRYVMIAISDDGCGMDEETRSQIFEPFYTTKDLGRGTGLGLSTVYGIVKQNNGFINVYSEPGKGTTFRIYLSRYEGNFSEAPDKTPTSVPCGSGQRILIVEDECNLLEIVKAMLEELEYQVLTETNPEKALAFLMEGSNPPDLVITDVIMPGMSGKEMADEIWKTSKDLKILFMSGYTSNAIVHHGVLDSDVNFIQKPFSLRELGLKVQEVLEHP